MQWLDNRRRRGGTDYGSGTQREGGIVIGLSAAAYIDTIQSSRGWAGSGIREAEAEEG